MISYELVTIGSYSIAIAVIAGLIRFRKIIRAYQPFIFLTIAALCHEVTSTILIQSSYSNAISTNIFNLTECLLWIWQFKRWEAFHSNRWKFRFLLIVLCGVWVTENIVLWKLFTFSSVFSILFSFTLVFLSINQVNNLIVLERKNLLTNSRFLICTGIIIFYTYRIMVESFYIFHLDQSNDFLSNVYYILVFVNLFVNLLFALATIWIPTRQKFTLPF